MLNTTARVILTPDISTWLYPMNLEAQLPTHDEKLVTTISSPHAVG